MEYLQIKAMLESGDSKGALDFVNQRLNKIKMMYSILTPREKEVAELLTEGMSNEEIATKLNCSVRTIKSYVASLFTKFGTRDRLQTVIMLMKG
jgi:DNA-binding NarL/FixJ family response regulator